MTRWSQNEGVNIPSFTGASCSHSSRNRFPEHFHPIWNIFWTLSSRANSQKGERLLFFFSSYYIITSKCGWYLISYDQGRHGWSYWPTILFQIRSLCKDERFQRPLINILVHQPTAGRDPVQLIHIPAHKVDPLHFLKLQPQSSPLGKGDLIFIESI